MIEALAVLLVLGGMAAAVQAQSLQPPPLSPQTSSAKPTLRPPSTEAPAKSRLEELLEQALKNNPDLRVATAKLVEAEAEVSRMRLQVVQKVVQAYQAVEAAKTLVAFHEKELKRFQELAGKGTLSAETLAEKERQFVAAKAQVAAAEADLAYLLGIAAAKGDRDTAAQALVDSALVRRYVLSRVAEEDLHALTVSKLLASTHYAAAKTAGPMTERIRKALDQSISVHFDDVPLSEALDFIRSAWNVPMIEKLTPSAKGLKIKVNMENVTLTALIQLLEDLVPGHYFVVREYGLLVAQVDQLPPGALRVRDFRLEHPQQNKPDAPPEPKRP
jgi:hypothetical protein